MITAEHIHQKCARIGELKKLNDPGQRSRGRTREIMAGGNRAVAALLGPKSAKSQSELMAANLMLTAAEKFGEKLGRAPTTKKEAPITAESEQAWKRAERIARMVDWYDQETKMRLLLPQLGMWLPGYGFAAMIVRHGRSRQGFPFPAVELRDPYETYPGQWGVAQQPSDIGFCRIMDREDLARQYPHLRDKIMQRSARGPGGAVLLYDQQGYTRASWANQNGAGIEVWEYYDQTGCWWLVPEIGECLTYTPNLMSRPQFYVMKRFSFDRLAGQFDEMIGLLAGMARGNRLFLIMLEDLVLTETNVIGDFAQGEEYQKGRDAVNHFTPGTRVEKPGNHVAFEAFNILQGWERQARIGGSYPVTDDGISPMSFVTGRGMDELSGSNDLKVKQYHTIISDGLAELDAMRLEWDETYYPQVEKTMAGRRAGSPFSEKYTPARHIAGDYITERVFGAMAGFDEPTKITTGLQLVAAEAMDIQTLMENVDGLGNISEVRERIAQDRDRKVLNDTLAAMGLQGDQRVLAAMIARLPDGEEKRMLGDIFTPPAEEAAPVEEQQPEGLEQLLGQLQPTFAPIDVAA